MTDPPRRVAAIVTGGSSGIGRATADKFIRLGYSVAICARRLTGIRRVEAELSQMGPCLAPLCRCRRPTRRRPSC